MSAKFCVPCGEIAKVETKRRYAAKKAGVPATPFDREQQAKWRERGKSRIIQAGAQRSEATPIHFDRPTPKFAWLSRFWVPFTYSASKNRRLGFFNGGVFKSHTTSDFEQAVIRAANDALERQPVLQKKVWIGIHVEKPDNRGDAVNVVDTVCDALKVALGVDDRWFCLSFVDWSVNKNEPRILIQVAQEPGGPEQVCSHCGHILPFDHFRKKRTTKNGIDRVCKGCHEVARDLPKQARNTVMITVREMGRAA